jgi:hypothetical protein
LNAVAKLSFIFFLTYCAPSFADCVFGAKDKTKFTLLDNRTILLQGGSGSDIIIKTLTSINRASSITVLKDSFCSHENAVLYVDGEVLDVNQVTKVR